MKSALLAVCAFVSLLSSPCMAYRASDKVISPRQSFNFDIGWKMHIGDEIKASTENYPDKDWENVNLPNAFNETQAFATGIKQQKTDIIWYRKHFKLPKDFKGGHVFIEFQGVRQAAEIWVNGTEIGLNENGVAAFGFDISHALKAGDNVIAVRVDNDWKYKERTTGSAFQWNDINFNANYGGISKPVRLHLTGDIYQTLPLYENLGTIGNYIWANEFNIAEKSALIHFESQIKNDSPSSRNIIYSIIVRDLDGKIISQFDGDKVTINAGETKNLTTAKKLFNLNFWSWGYGYLYTITTMLKDENGQIIDAIDTKTGFRKTEFANGMVKLNDRVLHLKGYAQRSTNEWPAIGTSIPPWMSDFSNGLMTGSNANLVRWMHITPPKQDVESSDRLGLLEAMPAGDSEGDTSGRRWQQRLELMRDSIIYNRNNPSIVFYEAGNKGISEDHMAQMKAIYDEYDPHGGRAIGAREMLDSKIAQYGGEMLYPNKSQTKPLWGHEYERDEAARAYSDALTPPFHKDAPDYNRNMEPQALEDIKRWADYYDLRPGLGDRVNAGAVKIGFTDSNSHFRGDNNYRRSGVIDALRLKKETWYIHQLMWDGWVNSEVPRTYIIGHWNYPAGTIKPVYVASNGESVELFLNGKSLGQGEKSSDFLFTFKDIKFTAGQLKAVSQYSDGRKSEFTLTTTGKPDAIRLTPIYGPRGLVADGSDIMLVDVEVIDKDGNRVPTAFNPISFKLEGAAVWKGGMAQKESANGPTSDKTNSDNYILATTLPVEIGINRVLIRSTNHAGKIQLSASADGLKPAILNTKSQPVTVNDGLSKVFPEDFQKSDLSRGATPLTPSFTPILQTIKIANITAGSNDDTKTNSHDDNESSTWTSDGTPQNAWIEYDFDTPHEVSLISMRLTGWRIRSYPIKITLDGKNIWEGKTQKSLGYVNIPLPPTKGQKLRISLSGATNDFDAFGNIVEVNKDLKVAASVGADKVPGGWRLSIVEADILGPINQQK